MKTLQKRIAKEQEHLSDSLKELQKRRFTCQKDAHREAAKWLAKQKIAYHELNLQAQNQIQVCKRDHRG